jgi:hypothetical protein
MGKCTWSRETCILHLNTQGESFLPDLTDDCTLGCMAHISRAQQFTDHYKVPFKLSVLTGRVSIALMQQLGQGLNTTMSPHRLTWITWRNTVLSIGIRMFLSYSGLLLCYSADDDRQTVYFRTDVNDPYPMTAADCAKEFHAQMKADLAENIGAMQSVTSQTWQPPGDIGHYVTLEFTRYCPNVSCDQSQLTDGTGGQQPRYGSGGAAQPRPTELATVSSRTAVSGTSVWQARCLQTAPKSTNIWRTVSTAAIVHGTVP